MHFCTRFTIPRDAKPGHYFNLILEVQDDAKKPITRYEQVIVTVKDSEEQSGGSKVEKKNTLESLFRASNE